MNWFFEFPSMDQSTLVSLKDAINGWFNGFTVLHGETIQHFFDPVDGMLKFSERFMTDTPWPVVLLLIAGLTWFASRRWTVTLGVVATLIVIGYFDLWEGTMETTAMALVGIVLCIVIGLPIGILMARFHWLQRLLGPVFDFLLTLPSLIFLIPVVMLLGYGDVPGLLAVVFYAIAPTVRLTSLGIRKVDRRVLEVADAFGSSSWQRLRNIQVPLALPTIMNGINQSVMMVFAMVIVASIIKVQGLGQPVLESIASRDLSLGLFNGLAVIGLALIFDRVSRSPGKRLKGRRGAAHG